MGTRNCSEEPGVKTESGTEGQQNCAGMLFFALYRELFFHMNTINICFDGMHVTRLQVIMSETSLTILIISFLQKMHMLLT